ncbi:MAG TPA: amino acid adenylation domain-containing protein, partial [Ignavibacteria bacterium]|nr:amino acid adenylation domain-containing protein [Ignavibacteria bacterium]
LLHIDKVGIHDNFFELGGDSIITIQVLSRSRRLGYELKPKDIFIHQTIAGLSEVLAERTLSAVTGEQGELKGEAGLLPIQQWYFEEENENVSHFNQSILLSVNKDATPEMLEKAMKQLTSHHDALRFIYKNSDGIWSQEYGTNFGEFITEDIRSVSNDDFENRIKKTGDRYQAALDIEKGEIVKFVLIQTPESGKENRLLLIIHHLAIDGVSWRIILEDLEIILTGLSENRETDLGKKTSSYRQWFKVLEQYGKSKELLLQDKYWTKTIESYEPVKTDKEYDGAVRAKDIKSSITKLDEKRTRLLLSEVPGVYHTEINDILLCALSMTISEWNSNEKVIIGMEGHGRESISESVIENTDTSRTVGWFTSLYPVLIELNKGLSISGSIKSVKEQLRRVPDKGLGFGVLKYINKEKKYSEKAYWDIVFNYLGQLDQAVSGSKWFSGAGESAGEFRSPEQIISEKLSVNGMIRGGELLVNWTYSDKFFKEETIASLAEKYKENLEALISHCMEQQKSGSEFTPSDYGLGNEISYDELDKFLDEDYEGNSRRETLESIYRLSGLQQGMLFHALYDSESGAYTEQLSCYMNKPDMDILKKSWNYLLKDHSILRSGFYYEEFSVPVQCVYKNAELPLTVLDYSNMNSDEQAAALKELEETDHSKGFDFKEVPLMRITLIKLEENRYKMLWTSHHILFDGWSLSILMGEFLNNYEILLSGKIPEERVEDRFEDYIRYLERSDKVQQEKYWREYMRGVEESTLLPFIGSTSDRTKGVGEYGNILLKLDKETTSKAENYAQSHRITLNTLIQGVWSYLLHAYTGNKDITFGVIVSGRPDDFQGIEQRVGLYINTLPLHSILEKGKRTESWLQDIQKDQVSSRQYQYTPLQEIQSWTGVSGDLFDSILVFENYPVSDIIMSQEWTLKIDDVKMKDQTNYPMTVLVGGVQEINVNFNYNKEILKDEFASEIREHFENVLMQIISNEAEIINDIKLLSHEEERQVIAGFNNTEADYPKDKSLVDLFEEQAAKNPETTAVEFEEKIVSYKELNELSNRIAHLLRSEGVKEETLVPVCMERSVNMIAGIIGTLKAGGAYVPIDPEYPQERINFMLDDTGAKIILSSKLINDRINFGSNVKVIEIDENNSVLNSQKDSNPDERVKPDNLTYVLYTSGSTGNPKGVRMPGRGLVNLLSWQDRQFENKKRKVLQFTSLNFDVSFQEIFSTLCYGSTLCLISADRRIDMEEVTNDIAKYGITHLFVPYIVLKNLSEILRERSGDNLPLEQIITAGEQLKITEDIKAILDKGISIVNQYGPTEAHVVSSYTLVNSRDLPVLPPIGKPIFNTQLYILNEDQKPVPVGVKGELYIGGIQIARGYLNLPELTNRSFIKDPFSKDPDARLYRTGDTARWLSDGNIEYTGRADDQIKIRGYRVELGEIESIIQQHKSVRKAVTLAKEDNTGNKRLAAYVVPEDNFDKEEIISYIKAKLPEYMVPSLWVEVEEIPLTPNGKVDKRALPDPDITAGISGNYEEPRNETEEKLALIWQDLLGSGKIGIHDNFFELGGHSLLATRAVSAIRKQFSVNIPIKSLFEFTSIADLGKYIDLIKSNKEKDDESEVFDL